MTTETTTTRTTMARQPSTHTTTTSAASGPGHGMSFKDRLAMFERTGDSDTPTKATRQQPILLFGWAGAGKGSLLQSITTLLTDESREVLKNAVTVGGGQDVVVHTHGGGTGAHTTSSAPPAGPRAGPVPTNHGKSFKDRLAMFESSGDGDMSIKATRQQPLVYTPGQGAGAHTTNSSVRPAGPSRKGMIPAGPIHGVSFQDRLAMFERPTAEAEAVETKEEVAEAATPPISSPVSSPVSSRRAVRVRGRGGGGDSGGGQEATATTAAAGTLLSAATAVSPPLLGPPTAAQSHFSRLVPRRTFVTASQPLPRPPTTSRPRFSRLVSRCTFGAACVCHPWLTRGQYSSAPPGGVSVGPPLAVLPQSVVGSAVGVGG